MPFTLPTFDCPPHRLSGVVCGVLLNHAPALAALGERAAQPPYKAAPHAPVLQVKPRNTLAANGAPVTVPAGVEQLEIGATLGIVIGQTACRVDVAQALAVVAGYTVINDLCVPHDSHYRPAVRQRARDGYCLIGPVVAAGHIADPDALAVRIEVDGQLAQATDTGARVRGVARLLADVSDFMTLHPGDVLMLGASHGAPLVRAGQRVTLTIDGVGTLSHPVIAEVTP
jgi:5-oxopent-3-ene-1,2,5-tricarboxylate decarboxylase / 2-hydroxyhepta-2,4-diene-1,7-dioate isomerase